MEGTQHSLSGTHFSHTLSQGGLRNIHHGGSQPETCKPPRQQHSKWDALL